MIKQLSVVLIFVALLSIFHLFFLGGHQHEQLSSSSNSVKNSLKNSKPSVSDDKNSEEHIRSPRKKNDNENLDCKSLPLHQNASQFGHISKVTLCWNSKKERDVGCGGFLKIYVDKKKEKVNSSSSLSSNAQLRQDILNRGPHQFRFRLDGPEVFVVSASSHQQFSQNEDFFVYTYNIPESLFRTSGKYRIGLEMLFRNYAYLDESRDVWPELLKIPLLPVDEEFAQTTKYHLQQCTLPARRDLILNCQLENGEEKETTLPVCDGHTTAYDTSGTWRRQENTNNNVVTTRVRVRKIRKDPITFEWALQTEPEARWWPRACKIFTDFSREQIYEKFGGKRIVVSGDSQLRALYYAVVNTLLGNGDICVRNITTQASEPRVCVQNVKGSQRKSLEFSNNNEKKKYSPIQVDYVDDLFLTRIKQKLGYNYDVIIAGFGQHPASKEHWRFDKYAGAVTQRMAQLKKIKEGYENVDDEKKSKKNKKQIIWYTAPHYPHTRQGYPVAVKDWRTDSRLELFNNYSRKAARENGFAVLDSMPVSDAFMHTSPDQAHFSNFVASEFVRMLLSMLMVA